MRLKQIKLAGFKSFVDPTDVEFPSALVGVAGPNGSGKSNIIDAVRWVMGESSAKHMRGGQMADVIFNGSGGRQPLGSASVEMIFDNSEGRLGGEYAGWSEIAIRRSVDREGVSGYFLNGTRCRRRDITDVFLGTGLGPRSYAIIEQGTISRLVESRPEELREFLEEAAGISRYKERRRETETRIRHTRENLERVDDLMEEVEKRLSHLRRQARAAERYQEHKTEERRLRAELLALRIRALETELAGREGDVRERGLAVEAEVTRERSIERDLTTARSEHDDALAAANRIQQRYFDLQTEIARLEESIAGANRERELHRERLEAITAQLAENESRAGSDEERTAELCAEVERLDPELNAAELRAREAQTTRDETEAAAADRLEEDSAHRAELAEARRVLAVAEAGIEATAEREKTLIARSERLGGERARIEEQTLSVASEAARDEAAQLRARVAEAEERVTQAESGVNASHTALREAVQKVAEINREQASVEGRLESLDRLARIAQGSDEAERWLGENGLRDARRLAAAIEIESGWEWAVEVALGNWLEALEVESLNDIAISLAGLDAGTVSFAARGEAGTAPAGTLAARVRSPFPAVAEFLAGVRAADSRAAVFAARESLGPGESVISRDGIWCGRDWLRVVRRLEGEAAGAIEREREHARLRARHEELEREIAEAERERAANEQALNKAESDYAGTRELARGARDELAAALTREAEAGGREQSARERLMALGDELGELAEQIAAAGSERERLRELLSRSRSDCERLESAGDAVETALAEARALAASGRAAYEAAYQAREALARKLESSRLQAQAAAETTRRLREERETLAIERGRLQGRLGEMDDPGAELQRQLEGCLDTHREVNTELTAARDRCSTIETRVTELERARHGTSARVAELREGLEGARLAAQQLQTRCEGLVEQLEELNADANEVLAAIEEDANADEWEQRLEAVGARIQRLGAINLTAIDECAAEAEREDYLKRQREDLTEAMQTLENAIRKIDRETRARFKETFDRINQRLGELFPRLFGGGTAALVLTGEELLDAGVLITAHPPGKKNATIQMLSGGEKALVAVALVFAIFELNPAPFCLLDEVDAPMDDANVDRFCELVKELSANTQFVLITHNRRTMTLCRQLIGVTMQEPGVSRLVGVDVDEAERLAVG